MKDKAKELLASGDVKAVIGYKAGSVPFKCAPCFAETAEDAERLVWNPTCVNNLSVYLPSAVKQGKVAVVVKPCDAKSVVELLKEHQIERENVVVICVPCPGVLNADALAGVDLRDVRSIEWRDGGLAVITSSGETMIPAEKAFAEKCLSCELGNPEIADVNLGDQPARRQIKGAKMSLEGYQKLTPAERRAFWAKEFAKCIRCYACRQACPGCYCAECFVDKPGQMWVMRSTDANTNWFFHTTRAMHLAGRCIGCNECERACPMGIPLSLLNMKLDEDVEEMFDYEAGKDEEALPALGSYDVAKDPDPCPEA